jgi:hypothetical protein
MKTIIVSVILLLSVAHAQYSLTFRNSGGARDAQESNTFRATVMKDGTELSSFERVLPYDVPFPAAYIHPVTGTVVLSFIFDGFVEVYTASGKKLWEQQFFKEIGPNYERTITTALGTASVVFLSSDVTLPNATVRKFSLNGALAWEAELPYPMGNEIALSPDEQFVAAGSYLYQDGAVKNSTVLFSGTGKEAASYDILFKHAAFSEDGRFLSLSTGRAVSVISLETKEITVTNGRVTDGLITGLIWKKGSLIVQESQLVTAPDGTFSYADPTFILYSSTLSEVRRQTLTLPSFKHSTLRRIGDDILFTGGTASTKIFVQE